MQLVLGQIVDRDRAERVEPDVQRDPLDVEPCQHLGCEVQPCRRRCRGALCCGVDGLIALRVVERLGDVRRQRGLPGRLALEPQPPAPFAERLDQLDRAQPLPGFQLSRGTREPLPEPVRPQPLEQQYLRLSPARAL